MPPDEVLIIFLLFLGLIVLPLAVLGLVVSLSGRQRKDHNDFFGRLNRIERKVEKTQDLIEKLSHGMPAGSISQPQTAAPEPKPASTPAKAWGPIERTVSQQEKKIVPPEEAFVQPEIVPETPSREERDSLVFADAKIGTVPPPSLSPLPPKSVPPAVVAGADVSPDVGGRSQNAARAARAEPF